MLWHRPFANHYDAEAVKRDGWTEQGVLVINADDARLDWTERELIKHIGNFLYGERVNNGIC